MWGRVRLYPYPHHAVKPLSRLTLADRLSAPGLVCLGGYSLVRVPCSVIALGNTPHPWVGPKVRERCGMGTTYLDFAR